MLTILRTHQISSAIIDLIDETDTHAYLVSPYFKPWPLLNRALARAAEQKKRLTFILRDEPENRSSSRRLNQEYGCEVVILQRLHTKLYLNERRAVVSSMNLYDSSQELNYEMGLLIKNRSEVQQLRKEVIQEDLFALPPKVHLSGWFSGEQNELARQMQQLEAEFSAKGFCVTCSAKVDLDIYRNPERSVYVRCRSCWSNSPDADPWNWRIRHCHYCGEQHPSILKEPYHPQCLSVLKSFWEWRQDAVTTPAA